MSASDRNKKLRIFDVCSKALQRLTGISRELCICPLCGDYFERQAIDNKVLTLEHVPPESLGGKAILLTCHKCNCRVASKGDSNLHLRHRHQDVVKALLEGSAVCEERIRLKMAGESLNFSFVCDPNEKVVKFMPRGNNPESLIRWRQEIERYAKEDIWDGQEFEVNLIDGFHLWLSKVGDLRIAYLVAVAAFGYSYALNARLDPIRKQLMNPESQLMHKFWSFVGWGQAQPRFIAIATEPIGLVYVSLGHSVVLLPSLAGPSDLYKVIDTKLSTARSICFRTKEVPWPDVPRFELDFL